MTDLAAHRAVQRRRHFESLRKQVGLIVCASALGDRIARAKTGALAQNTIVPPSIVLVEGLPVVVYRDEDRDTRVLWLVV